MWWMMLMGCGGGAEGCPERTLLDDGECVWDETVCARQGMIVEDGECVCNEDADMYPYRDECRHKNDPIFEVDTGA